MKNILLTSCFFFLLKIGFSQETKTWVTGRVMDANGKQPLQGASAFCVNTSFGSISNAEGYFKLYLPSGGYDLMVSFTGYERQSFRINTQNASNDTLQVLLTTQSKNLEEVTVVASNEVPDGWNVYGQFFKEQFIGTSNNAINCKILNPEVLHFFYNKKKNRLKVTAKEDLLIENSALGYYINYQLDSFAYQYANESAVLTGYALFREMDTTEAVMSQFRKNRAATFLGSKLHFMHTVYDSTVKEEGFILQKVNPSNNSQVREMTNLYDSLHYNVDSEVVVVDWTGTYRVIYKARPEKTYLDAKKLDSKTTPYQLSLMIIEQGLEIERNGYFFDQNKVSIQGYWAWKKIAESLPDNYEYEDEL